MKVSGTSHLSADRDAVWRALNDPGVLVRTIPGCRRLEALGGDAYKMTIAAGVGSIKGVYDGQGAGAPGTIGADVLVTLAAAAGGGTELTFDADATVGGMIGGVGQRMLTGVSKKMAAEFFANVDSVLAEGPVPAVGDASPGSPAVETTGQVFTAPAPNLTGGAFGSQGFMFGVAVGAVAALAGALVGGWLAGRRRN